MTYTELVNLKKKSESFHSAFVLANQLDEAKRNYDERKRLERIQLIDWMKEKCLEVRYFLTLTFSYEPSRDEAEKAAKIFQHEVSKAIAGKRATRHGRYTHPMSIVIEQQPYERYHLHAMMEALPVDYQRIVYVDDLKMKCAQIWQKLRYRDRLSLLIEQRKNPVNDICAAIAGEHSSKWFQELSSRLDIDRCFEYITKTFNREGSNCFVAL